MLDHFSLLFAIFDENTYVLVMFKKSVGGRGRECLKLRLPGFLHQTLVRTPVWECVCAGLRSCANRRFFAVQRACGYAQSPQGVAGWRSLSVKLPKMGVLRKQHTDEGPHLFLRVPVNAALLLGPPQPFKTSGSLIGLLQVKQAKNLTDAQLINSHSRQTLRRR